MAKLKFGHGVAEIRGHVGGTVYSRNASGSYMREKVSPVQPQTDRQTAVRSTLSDISKAWSTLTTLQREGWAILADSYPQVDIFGNAVPLSGIAMYQKVNGALVNAGESRLDDPPAALEVTSIESAVATMSAATRTVSVTFTPDPLDADTRLVIWATPRYSPGKKFVDNLLKFAFASNAGAGSAQTVVLGDNFGAYDAGDTMTVSVGALNITNGAMSIRSSSVVTVGA